MFSDELERMPVFLVFVTFFTEKVLDYSAIEIIRTVGTCFKLPLFEAACLHPALASINVPLSGLISQLTAATVTFSNNLTSLAVRPTTPDFYNAFW